MHYIDEQVERIKILCAGADTEDLLCLHKVLGDKNNLPKWFIGGDGFEYFEFDVFLGVSRELMIRGEIDIVSHLLNPWKGDIV